MPNISKAAVVGGGVIGAGWIARLIENGIDVEVYDPAPDAREKIASVLENADYANAKLNPSAQTRNWFMNYEHACSTGQFNANIGGRIKLTDCSQVTDGAAGIILASAEFAAAYAKRTGKTLDQIPRVRRVTLPDCGHLPFVERPTRFLTHLQRFLADPPAA